MGSMGWEPLGFRPCDWAPRLNLLAKFAIFSVASFDLELGDSFFACVAGLWAWLSASGVPPDCANFRGDLAAMAPTAEPSHLLRSE